MVIWAAFSALLIIALSQLPLRRDIDIGRADAGFVQGMADPAPGAGERRLLPGAAVRLPQIGAPLQVTMRLRAPVGTPLIITANGAQTLDRFAASGAWEDRAYLLSGGWSKAFDVFLTIESPMIETVALDRVTITAVPPLLPYPAQLLYAALVGALSAALLAGKSRWYTLAAIGGYGAIWLLLYRASPYPLRLLPPFTVATLAAIWLVWRWPLLRWPRWAPLAGVALVVAGWALWLLPALSAHVTLARPGVENDFRVFATRDTLATIFQADGFYQLGYPLLLWLIRPLTNDNPFLAGRALALAMGCCLLVGSYLLARCFLPPASALLAPLILAGSGMVAQYGLLVGSDMPFAALFTLAVALTIRAARYPQPGRVALAGLLAGAAFLIRHPGLLLLGWGALTLWLGAGRRAALGFALGFALAAAPQLVVNTLQTGQPLYNQQAKNIWLAVYGNTDWNRWAEVPNSISLIEVVGGDPGRFALNWMRNLIGFVGAGAEDVSEFGRADQLRLLGWPANWLAIGGLAAAGWLAWQRRADRSWLAMVALIGGYVAIVATAFILPRFWLPLAPIYAVAAAWALAQMWPKPQQLLIAALTLTLVLLPGTPVAARAVLDAQPADEVAAAQAVQANLPAGARLATAIPDRLPLAKYSAIAHLVSVRLPVPAPAIDLTALPADYLLWDTAQGPPPLADHAARQISEGRFALYRLR